jgi:nucleoid DNA-binding protein
MNKAGLIEAVAKELDCSKAAAARSVEAGLKGVRQGLRAEGLPVSRRLRRRTGEQSSR